MITGSTESDVIEVRPDERFDQEKVARFLSDKLPGTDRPMTVRQFAGGAANLTYLLDYGTHEYVLRRPPLGPVAKHAHDMAREYRVLSVLHSVFSKAPRAFLYCDDTAIIGAPFLVMERRYGVVVRQRIPRIYANNLSAPLKMSEALIDALADFHAVQYDTIGLGDLGRPKGFIERQIEGWYKRWHNAKTEDVTALDRVYAWLKASIPRSLSSSLVHNDFKLDNALLDPDDPSNIFAILDWDMCTLGDPLNDLGALLGYWIEPNDPPYAQLIAMMPVGNYGFPSRAQLVQRYAEKSGRSVTHIDFYYALALFRITVIVAQIYVRYKRGQTQDQRFAGLGQLIPLIARLAEDVTEGRITVA